jgi:hypothetical protein
MHSEFDFRIDNKKMDGWKAWNWRWEKEETIFFVNKDCLLSHNFWICLQSDYTNLTFSELKHFAVGETVNISRVTGTHGGTKAIKLATKSLSDAFLCVGNAEFEELRLSAKLVPAFADRGVLHSQCGGSRTAVTRYSRPDFTRTLAQSTSLEHSLEIRVLH